MPGHTILTGAAFYSDEYQKIDGEWKISRTGYERTYVDVHVYDEPKAFNSRWEK